MKKIFILIFTLSTSIVVYSQETGHYLSVGGNVGLSGYRYDLQGGNAKLGMGYGGKIGYSYFFHKNWGLGTGIGINTYQTEGVLEEYKESFAGQIDDEGDIYNKIVILSDNRRNYDDWVEIQRGTFLEIPLLMQYQHKFGTKNRHGIYANLGMKAQVPILSEYSIDKGNKTYEGQYEKWNVILDDLPEHGFTVFNQNQSDKVNLRTSFAVTGGFGFLLGLSSRVDLYLGAYCDYGLNNVKSSTKGSILYLDDNTNDIEYRSMLVSSQVDKIKLFSVGGEIGLRIRLGKDLKTSKPSFQSSNTNMLNTGNDAEQARQKAELARQIAEKETELARQKIDELESYKNQLDSLLAKAMNIKNATAERVMGENNLEAVKVEFNSNILFDVNKSTLTKSSRESLISLVQILLESPETNLDIFGHTDNTGSLELNQRLSQGRAQAVADYLYSMAIPSHQVRRVIGKNYSLPIADNTTEEGRSKNRRVEIYMYVNRK